jgi:hypothetical protein
MNKKENSLVHVGVGALNLPARNLITLLALYSGSTGFQFCTEMLVKLPGYEKQRETFPLV